MNSTQGKAITCLQAWRVLRQILGSLTSQLCLYLLHAVFLEPWGSHQPFGCTWESRRGSRKAGEVPTQKISVPQFHT